MNKRTEDSGRTGRWVWLAPAGIVILAAPIGCGAGPHEARPDATSDAKEAPEILREMIAAYRNASVYQDRAEVRLRYPQGEQMIEDTTSVRIDFARPNRLRLDLKRGETRVMVACDGNQLSCQVHDPSTSDFDGQVVERSAPKELTLPVVYSATEYMDVSRPSELFSLFVGLPVRLELTPVGLLLSGELLDQLVREAPRVVILEDGRLDGRDCYRVKLETDRGDLVFWIDGGTRLLRRAEYPTKDLFPGDSAAATESDVSLVADFIGANTSPTVKLREFQLRPTAAKRLRHFVLPPRANPSPVLGTRVGDFAFTDLQGKQVNAGASDGQLVTMVWFHDHPASRAALTQLQPVYEKYKNDSRVRFWAICTEPTTAMSHRQVALLARDWGITIPLLRDLQAFGHDLFKIERAPTLAIIASDGVVHVVEEGADPQLNEQLPVVLERLLAGEDIAGDFLRFAKQQQADYQRLLTTASVDAPSTEFSFPEAKVAEPANPQELRLTQLWTCRELNSPGNILVVDETNESQIHVVVGWTEVAEIGGDGQVRQRRDLSLPEDAAISYFRTTVDNTGRRYYVGTSRLARQLHVFDGSWQLLFSYPKPNQQHAGIQDIQLADLDADGSPELYVAFAGILGVQCVDLTGKRQWSNRLVHSVLSLELARDPSGQHRQLLAATQQGHIMPLDHAGREGRPISVEGRAVHNLVACPVVTQRPTSFCAVSYAADGSQTAIGLDAAMREIWHYRLPSGIFKTQLQYVTAGKVLGRAGYQWLFAGPDGSIHIVAEDGQFHDSFAKGEYVTGLASARLGGANVLLIATDTGISAWKVEHLGGAGGE